MVKPYRIKHKDSGYFYQRYNGSNLGKKGKVYMNNQSPLTMCDNENFIRIQIRHNTLAYKALRDTLAKYVIGKDDECEWHSTYYRVPKSEFEKEELQLMKIENIKFKAKRLDNGEWVYGSLIRSTAGVKERAYIVDNFSSMSDYSVVGIDPSTVCQFTGLKDCEGNEIWEGDIVEREIYNLYKGFTKVKAVVKYMDGEFVAITGGVPYSLYFKYIKVVGNKFDKKE